MVPSLGPVSQGACKYVIPWCTPNKTVRIESLFYFYPLLMCE